MMVIDKRFCGPPGRKRDMFVDASHSLLIPLPSPFVSCCQYHLIPSWRFEKQKEVSFFDGDAILARHGPQSSCSNRLRVRAAKRRRRHRDATGIYESHWFPCCFVCGPDRAPGDGLHVFAGPVEGSELVACPWVPDTSVASTRGSVSSEFLWAALDCRGPSPFPSLQVKRLSSESSG